MPIKKKAKSLIQSFLVSQDRDFLSNDISKLVSFISKKHLLVYEANTVIPSSCNTPDYNIHQSLEFIVT